MSAQEIIEQLPNLSREELRRVEAKMSELTALPRGEQKSVWEVLSQFAGTAKDLPPDFAEEHDHYLYGTPKRKR